MIATYTPYLLNFVRPSGTSRGVMHQRKVYFVRLTDPEHTNHFGVGECAPLPGLSIDDVIDYEQVLKRVCTSFDERMLKDEIFRRYPSILFGLETALMDYQQGGKRLIFKNNFSSGTSSIPINGLIWMGAEAYLKEQIKSKVDSGFRVIKLKISVQNFEEELAVLKWIRREFKEEHLILRVDANGAFPASTALESLKRLSAYEIHSIEQPIAPGMLEDMANLVQQSPIPIALDEELIKVTSLNEKEKLLECLQPSFIILKPSLHGGIKGCDEWIEIADALKIGWWMTSALESNVGLNAIAQYTYSKGNDTTHGLGTGGLFSNNIDSPLYIASGQLWYDSAKVFDLSIPWS